MKTTDRAILGVLALFGLILGFWFLILSPKRQDANELKSQVAELQASVDDQNAVAAFADQARKEFPKYYGRLVVLGKAVPDVADSASLMVQIDKISRDAGIEFRGIKLSEGAGSTTVAPATPPSTAEAAAAPSASDVSATSTSTPTGTTSETTSTTSTTTTDATATAAPATEADAANLPIGASVGTAGLPTLPYDLDLSGRFFDVSDFVSGIDDLIALKGSGQVAADGRLLTIDGFALTQDKALGFPYLNATFAVTAYSTPSTQGLTAGATPTGPGSAPIAPQTTVTSTTVTP